jgi:hypothetical protein
MQTRSADEPMTTFVTCVNCNNKWKCEYCTAAGTPQQQQQQQQWQGFQRLKLCLVLQTQVNSYRTFTVP